MCLKIIIDVYLMSEFIHDINWKPSLMTRVELHDVVLNECYWGFVVGFTAKQVRIQLVENGVVESDRDSKVIKPKWDTLGSVVIAKYYKGKYRCWGVKMDSMGFIHMLCLYTDRDKFIVYSHD